METALRRLLKAVVAWPLLFFLCIFAHTLWGPCEAVASMADPGRTDPPPARLHREAATARILAALEGEMGNRPVPGKVREKLQLLSDAQIRLLASLSEVISNGGHGGGVEIAFLLITALIVLS